MLGSRAAASCCSFPQLHLGAAPSPAVQMVGDRGEGAKYWPRWRGPSGQGLVDRHRLSGHLVGHRERAVEDAGAGQRQLVADRVGRSHLRHDRVRRRAAALGAGVSPLGRRAAVGDRSRRTDGSTSGRTTRTVTRRRRRRPTAQRVYVSFGGRGTGRVRHERQAGLAARSRPDGRVSRHRGVAAALQGSAHPLSGSVARLVHRRVRHANRRSTLWRTPRDASVGWGTPIADSRRRSRRDHRQRPAARAGVQSGHRRRAVALRRQSTTK